MRDNYDRVNRRGDHQDPNADWRRELDGWIDEVTRKPWFVALKDLAGDAGFWVGTEDGLMAELRARVDGDTGPSEGFPSDVGELTAPPSRVVEYALRKARLDVVDYRELEKVDRERYDVPGWGRKAPILVTRGRAGIKFTPKAAANVLAGRSPIAGLFVLFAYHDRVFTKNRREWTGTTRELAERLNIQYWNAVMFHTDWRIEEVERLLRLEHLEDFSRFCGRVRTAARILGDVGVKVSSEKATGRSRATGKEYTYTLWTVEAPRRLPSGP